MPGRDESFEDALPYLLLPRGLPKQRFNYVASRSSAAARAPRPGQPRWVCLPQAQRVLVEFLPQNALDFPKKAGMVTAKQWSATEQVKSRNEVLCCSRFKAKGSSL